MTAAPTILIMAGGTGGHVFPGLAVAEGLAARGARVHWLGTLRGLEAELVPRAGIPLHTLSVVGLRGKSRRSQLQGGVHLLGALGQAMRLLWRLRPDCVLGMGGYAAGPGGVASWLLRRPLLIHEQNAVPGTTNRLLAHLAQRVLQGFPLSWAGTRGRYVGNPVRHEISALPPPAERLGRHAGPLRLLVLGGSLGAQPINRLVPSAVARCPQEQRPEVYHQTGHSEVEAVTAAYQHRGITARVEPFIDDMAAAYGWADIVLCRAGALTIAELTAAGIGALLVPLPHAIDDHQTANARWLVEQGAGALLPQKELDAEQLARQFVALAGDRDRLLGWAEAARAAARPDSTAAVVQHCWEVAHA